jgi:hypothetical protein
MIMTINKDKIDDMTLALLNLVMWDESEQGARVWKGFDWDTMSRLHEKGFIQNPRGKAKSVFMLPEGVKKSKELFEEYFVIPDSNT